jgi:hypothetical protein
MMPNLHGSLAGLLLACRTCSLGVGRSIRPTACVVIGEAREFEMKQMSRKIQIVGQGNLSLIRVFWLVGAN